MAVDGKNASGRLAAAAVFWLLVAIFANQDYVYCQENQQEFDQRLQQQQHQQQQQQHQQQQLQRPPNQPQDGNGPNGIMGQMNNMGNDMQSNMNRLPGQPMNNDLGANNGIPKKQQQSLINVGAPLDMVGGGLVPSFSGGPSMVPVNQVGGPSMVPVSQVGGPSMVPVNQVGGPSQVPNFDETNLSQGMTNNNQPSGPNQWRPPLHFNEQMVGPNNNFQQKYPGQHFQARPMMSVPPHMQYQPNHHHLAMPNMNQPFQSQIQQPNQPQFLGNTDNIIPGSTKPFVGYTEQPNTNLGDNMMQPMEMFTNLIPENPLDFVQKPVGMMFNSFGKLGEYGGGVKEGVSNVLRDVVKKIFDQSQSGVNRVLNMGLSGSNAAFDIGRKIFLPGSSGQQVRNSKDPPVVDSSGRPNLSENESQGPLSSNPINPSQPIYHYGPG